MKIDYYITNLGDGYYCKCGGIIAKMSREKGEYCLEMEDIGMYVYSKDLGKAEQEIKNEMINLYNELSKESDEYLGKKPKMWKQYLNDHIGWN